MAGREDTLPGLMLRNAEVRGDKPAMREKDLGIWRTYSWSDYAKEVEAFALGLSAIGFGQGDKLVVIGDNRPRLYWAQIAAQSLGGAAVPVYQDSIAEELAFVLADADTKVVVAEDQEQIDKVLSIQDQLQSLTWLIYDDSRGMAHYDNPNLKSFVEVQETGRASSVAGSGGFAKMVDALDTDDVAVMSYTSGTTGKPKGVMLSHGNLIFAAKTFCSVEDVRESDDFISYLPMAWVGESMYGMALSLMVGCSCNCPEAPETLERDLRELGPTGFIASPRGWETILSQLQVRGNDTTGLKRWVYDTFRASAVKAENAKAEGRSGGLGGTLLRGLGEFLVYGPVRDQLGLRRARWCYTGGAPLGHDTFRFFRAFGINLKQFYGSTEVSGIVSVQRDNNVNPVTVGPPCAGIDVKMGDKGEILVKSPGVFKGYYKREDATAEAFTDDGYFRTGDAGVLDGDLTVIDRAKDVGSMADGTAYAPQFIESKLKFSAFISEAVSFGDGRDFVSVMIAIDPNTVGNWAEKNAITFTNYGDLSQKPQVRELIAKEIALVNTSLPTAVRVKRFLLLAKDLDADDAEVTRTRKLRRAFIAERYAPVIQAFYSNDTEVDLRTEVTFEDGRRSHVDARLLIQDAA
jgi:long-chain acyl-CoA synthetase